MNEANKDLRFYKNSNGNFVYVENSLPYAYSGYGTPEQFRFNSSGWFYAMDITRYVNNLVSGARTYKPFILSPYGSNTGLATLAFPDQKSGLPNRLKLNIYYVVR